MKDKAHTKRISKELKEAGMTSYGFMKLETDHLPQIIHEDEHVKGVIYGRYERGIDAVMLVATDKRVIFIDCKPFYLNWDEITYEVVAGIKMSIVGPFAGVVLHTRVKDYELRFVNIKCARKFTKYIERYIEKRINGEPKNTVPKPAPYQPYRIPTKETKIKSEALEMDILDDTAVLSTVSSKGNVHASVIHFVMDKDENIYFLTKTNTTKTKNISTNSHVALTIHNSNSLKALYIKGLAEVVIDHTIKQSIFEEIAKHRQYTEGIKLPPITKIKAGDYVFFKVSPTSSKLDDFSGQDW